MPGTTEETPATTQTEKHSAPDVPGGREIIPRGRMKDGKRAGFKKGRRGKKSF